jgi:hypothetical protein
MMAANLLLCWGSGCSEIFRTDYKKYIGEWEGGDGWDLAEKFFAQAGHLAEPGAVWNGDFEEAVFVAENAGAGGDGRAANY